MQVVDLHVLHAAATWGGLSVLLFRRTADLSCAAAVEDNTESRSFERRRFIDFSGYQLMPRLHSRILISVAYFAACFQVGALESEELQLWPDGLPTPSRPYAKVELPKWAEGPERIKKVEIPTLTLMRAPADKANGCAVVIFPGGGYNILAWQKEGLEFGEWFNRQGVTAVIVKYRVPRRGPDKFHLEPLQDAMRAIRLTRHHATDWGIDKSRVGVAGFSAGGHLAFMTASHFDETPYEKVDEIDEINARPDFLCGIYAAYLGDDYKDNVPDIGPLVNITKATPPTFLAVTMDDSWRGVQAGELLKHYKKAGVPVEAHIYSRGGHGYGLRSDKSKPVSQWPRQLGDWMKYSGFYEAS